MYAPFPRRTMTLFLYHATQAMVPTFLAPTFAPANLTLSSLSKNASGAPNEVVLVLSFTSVKRDAHWVRSRSKFSPSTLEGDITNIVCSRYLVYNLRKRGGDSADKYFKSTELIAGVKDMRFQALMPDILHWLGIKKIDNMVSMSDM